MLVRVRGSIGVLGLVLLLVWLASGRVNSRAEHDFDDGEVLTQYPGISRAFKSNTFSISATDGGDLGLVRKETRVIGEGVENTFELDGLSVKTEYRAAKSGQTRVKQVVTVTNTTDRDRTVEYRARMRIEARRVGWDGEEYPVTWVPRVFRAYRKQVSVPEFANKLGKGDLEELGQFKNYMHEYMAGSRIVFEAEGARGIYDWADALHLDPEVWVYRVLDRTYVEFVVANIPVRAGGEAIIDPTLSIADPANYALRYDGFVDIRNLTWGGNLLVGDVNGDNQPDLVMGTDSESLFVIFGGSGISTGISPLNVAGNYNIRYNGCSTGSVGMNTSLAIGDVNGDGLGDLIVGSDGADDSGTKSGSIWVIFSTLIDDVGSSTGNVKSLENPDDYNIRYDGAAYGDLLAVGGAVGIGDLNGDGNGDLVMGAPWTDYNGDKSGSVYVLFSTLVDDVGASTGNVRSLGDPGSYNIRYDGAGTDDRLPEQDSIRIQDLNGDGQGDLVLCSARTDYVAVDSGSVWVLFSTLIDDVGSTTGNIRSLGDPGSYNIRYDGDAADGRLVSMGEIAVGDVNGDGLGDLVFGDPYADYNGDRSGSVWVMFSTLIDDVTTAGNVKLLSDSGSYNIRYDGAEAGDQLSLGRTSIAIGDVNGDANDDLILGARWAVPGGAASGSAWVMFSTLVDDVAATTGNIKSVADAANYNTRYDGAGMLEYLGETIATGDVNGDGLGDLILGASMSDFGSLGDGSAWVFFSTLVDDVGSTTGNIKPLSIAANYNIRFAGAAGVMRLTDAGAVAIGDLNGDGFGDLLMGAPMSAIGGGGSGSALVVFSTLIAGVGATTGNDMPVDAGANYSIRYDGSLEMEYLTSDGSLATGDVNGDSIADLVVGTSYAHYAGGNSGSVFVIFGGSSMGSGDRPLSISSNFNIRFDGEAADMRLARFGDIAIGDVNGDGLGDLVLGEELGGSVNGKAFVVFSTLIDDAVTTGNIWPLSDPNSYNICYEGSTNAHLTQMRTIAIDDLNGDGISDLALGGSGAHHNGSSSGSVWVFFSTLVDDVGTTTGNNLSLDVPANYNVRFDGAAAGDYLTYYGAIETGDVNGDGLSDLVMGGFYADNNGSNSGSAWVVFSTLIDDVGTTTGNNMPLSNPANYNIRYDGAAAEDVLTYKGAIDIGDINGDGLGDLLLGSFVASNNGLNSGSVWVLFSTLIDDVGSTTGNDAPLSVPANYNIRYDGSKDGDMLSVDESVAIGDVNGDGFSDLILGSRYADYGGSSASGNDAGSAWVILSTLVDDVGSTTGNPRPLSVASNYNIRFDGSTPEDSLTSLGAIAIGDVSGDGIDDLILGAPNSDMYGDRVGALFVIFSLRIDDVGTTTGNVWPLSDVASYSHHIYSARRASIPRDGNLHIDDMDDDGRRDMVIGSTSGDYGGVDSGSAWVIPGGCEIDADCPMCYQCTGGACLFQPSGSDTRNECIADDCHTGNCDGNGFCGLVGTGTPCTDATPDDCREAQCDSTGICDQAFAIKSAGAACQDGLYCTDPDSCDGSGSCIPGAGDPCSGQDCSDICNEAADTCIDPDGRTCDDGVYCTDPDTCQTGICTGPPRDCSAFADDCNTGVCVESPPGCTAQPANEGDSCDDGQYCTVTDTCSAGNCAGTLRVCDDSDPCTTDFCDEAGDACASQLTPRPGAEGPRGDPTCSDGIDNDCDLQTDLDDPECVLCIDDGQCDDGNPCTTNTCVLQQCQTSNLPNGTNCDDGLHCTAGDSCFSGVCTAGELVDCSHMDNDCNIGICNETTDSCELDPGPKNGDRCEDGDLCTQNDTCQNGSCVRGPDMDCSWKDEECESGDCQGGDCMAFPIEAGLSCAGCYRCYTSAQGTQCDWSSNLSAEPCPAGECRIREASCDDSSKCVIEGYCDQPVEGCGIPVVYGKGPGETLECRMPEGKVGVKVKMEPASAGVGSFVPVRLYLTNTPINRWNKCIYNLEVVLEFNPEGEGKPGGSIAYVRQSALLQGGEVNVEEADGVGQQVILKLGGEDDCLPAPGYGELWVLDFLLLRGTFEEGWFKVNVRAPCDSPNEVMGCHTTDSSFEHVVSGTWYSYSSGKSFREGENVGQMLQSHALGCQCGKEGGGWLLGILMLLVLGIRFNYLKRANRDVTHRFEA